MEFKSSGNSGGCSSRAKLLIVIELTRWISRGPFRRWPMGVKGCGPRKGEKFAVVSFARQPCRPGWRSKIDPETYRSLSDNNRRDDEEPPLEFDALYTPIFLAHSNRLCDPVKMVERFSTLFDERRISTTVSIVRMNVFVYHNFLHERPYSVIDIHDSE